MAAGAAAAAERGLLRLLQRLDEKAKEEALKKEQEAEKEEKEEKEEETKEEGKRTAEKAERESDSELRRYLQTELSELSGVWSKSSESSLVRSLGEHLERLSCAVCAKAVRAFVPLQDEIEKQMAALTDAFNAWLAENLETSTELELSEEACRSILEHLKALEEMSYLRSCYRWVAHTEAKVRFLMALALVLRALGSSKNIEETSLREISDRLLQRFFGEGEDSLEASRQRCFVWLEGRLGRYDKQWRGTAEKAKALGFQGELRRHLGRALEKELKEKEKLAQLADSAEHSEFSFLELQCWPMAGCGVAKALVSFVADYSLQSCPEHSLQPAALLHVLNELLDPFDVEESRGRQGGVRLNATWEAMKAESDAPPPPPPPSKEAKPPTKARPSATSSTKPPAEAPAEAQPPSPKAAAPAAADAGSGAVPEDAKAPGQAPQAQDTQKRSRSRSSSASLQPKLLKARKKEPKEPKEPKASKDKGEAGEAEESKEAEAGKEKRSSRSSSEPPEPKAKKAPPPNHSSHVNAGAQYFYPMPWGPHMVPGMMPGHRPGLPLTMLPQPYLMPGMPMMGMDKKKKDKHDKHDRRKEKHRKEKEREKVRDESESESTRERKRRKKKEKAAKKDKKDKSK
ncbi:unnamed protein product [Symbiodinium sp. KB8]|nr:unnamed protein product [Symbiodinium sp. KB8]